MTSPANLAFSVKLRGSPLQQAYNRGVCKGVRAISMSDVTQILFRIKQGDSEAADRLLPLVYDELRKLAAQKLKREKPGQNQGRHSRLRRWSMRLTFGW